MAKYRVLERSFVSNRLVEPGAVIEHEFTDGGTHGPNLEPLVVEKKGRKVPSKPGSSDSESDPAGDDLS